MATENEVKASKEDKDILAEALSRMELSREAEAEIRKLSLEDLEFRAGNHWPEEVKMSREVDSRPCLVINKIPQFVQQITNDQRQNRPSIKVHPVDDKGDVDTAKVIQGIIRHVEYNSDADNAYDTAFESAVTGGFGYFRVTTDYEHPLSFNQDILIKRIRNPFSVYFDPYSQEPDGSDASFAFVVEDLSADEFKARYPHSKLSKMDDWTSIGNNKPFWVREDGCRVAEYFYKEFKEVKLLLLEDGNIVEHPGGELGGEFRVLKERNTIVPVVKWCKITGVEILEKTIWPSQYIPVIPVYGTEIDVDGKIIREGIVRNTKDSQRMYNYWASAETETIALAPKAPFIAAEGQIEGYEHDWETANQKNHAVLTYKPRSVAGEVLPAPNRNVYEPPVQAITQARMLASDDMKATTGIYDASLGSQSNETSGIAIQRRNVQAQTSNFHFIDNLSRSIKHAGRIIVDLIPTIYDTARAARIIGEDGEQEVVRINEPYEKNGKQKLYRMDVGKYDVAIDIGPSFASKRQEAVASMLDVIRSYPAVAQFAGDLLVKNMDWPGSQEFADRLRKTIPPEILGDNEKGQQVPPQVQAQMQQMNSMIDQLTKQLNDAQDKIDHNILELESKERIEFAKLESDMRIQLAKMDSNESVQLLKQEILAINSRLKLLDIDEPIEDEQEGPEQELPNGAQEGAVEEEPTGGQSPGIPVEGM